MPDSDQPAEDGGPFPVDLRRAAPLALEIGWTLAILEEMSACGPAQRELVVPTGFDLSAPYWVQMQAVRLDCDAATLSGLIGSVDDRVPLGDIRQLRRRCTPGAGGGEPDWEHLSAYLGRVHRGLLPSFACADPSLVLSYQLGRSLRSITSTPRSQAGDEARSLLGQLGKDQVLGLQQQLGTIGPHFPPRTTSVVSASLGRWSQFVTTTLDPGTPGRVRRRRSEGARWGRGTYESEVARLAATRLPRQAETWISLLTGVESPEGLLTPEAEVAAGEAALSRTIRIVRRVALHYWVALLVLGAALVTALSLSAAFLVGAGRVWTDIASIAASLGVTARGIGARVARFTDAAGRPMYRAAEVDAIAWAVTSLPAVDLNHRAVRALRRAGIQKSSPLGRV